MEDYMMLRERSSSNELMSERINELMNERNSIMKAMKYILMVISMVGVLSVSAQPQTEQPQTQFQSTSTMVGSGSVYTPAPSLNADGTAYNPAEAATPAKKGGIKTLGPTPDEGLDEKDKVPVGDAVLPLLLCAAAFCGVIALRRKRALNR